MPNSVPPERLSLKDVPLTEWQRIGRGDPVVDHMLKKGIAITRQSYLTFAYPEGIKDWGPELEAELPWPLQVGAFDDQDDVKNILGLDE